PKSSIPPTRASSPPGSLLSFRDRGLSLERIRQGRAEDGHKEQYYGHQDEKNDESVAHDIAGTELKQSQDRQHPEWLHQISERFSQVVGGHNPAEMNLEVVRRGHDVRRLDDPFRTAGGHKHTEHG